MTSENSVEHFCYSGTKRDECVFNWSIKDFSMHAQKGCRTSSPVFESSSGSQWCLILCIEEVCVDEKYEDFITVHLENRGCNKKQFAKVKLSICNRLGKPAESNNEEVFFDSWTSSSCQKVFSISKDYVMKELLGLNRMLLVPDDVFTVRCEMTITEESPAVVFESKNAYDSSCESYSFKNNLVVLWFTGVFLFLRPVLFRGKEGIIFVYKALRELCIYAWPIIIFLVPIVYRILCFISNQGKHLIVWSYKKYKTPKVKNTTDVLPSRQRSTYPQKYPNNRPQIYQFTEADMQRLFEFFSSEKSPNRGPRAVKGAEDFWKKPKLTYPGYNNYQKTGPQYV